MRGPPRPSPPLVPAAEYAIPDVHQAPHFPPASGPCQRRHPDPAPAQTSTPAPTAPPTAPDIAYPRVFTGRHLTAIAFPLGGVAAGAISLGGRGQLRDWEIFNRPDKGNAPSYAFPAIWAQAGTRKPVARVLESRIQPPYEGSSGLGTKNAPGLVRLASATFTGEFPLARIDFADPALPVRVSLEAFTPFIPHDPDESGLPVADPALSRHQSRRGARESLDRLVDRQSHRAHARATDTRVNEYRSSPTLAGLFMHSPDLAAADPLKGSFALAALDPASARVTYLRGWQRDRWWNSPMLFWDDFSADGELGPEPEARSGVGALCLNARSPPARTPSSRSCSPGTFPIARPRAAAGPRPRATKTRHRQLVLHALRRRLGRRRVRRRATSTTWKRRRAASPPRCANPPSPPPSRTPPAPISRRSSRPSASAPPTASSTASKAPTTTPAAATATARTSGTTRPSPRICSPPSRARCARTAFGYDMDDAGRHALPRESARTKRAALGLRRRRRPDGPDHARLPRLARSPATSTGCAASGRASRRRSNSPGSPAAGTPIATASWKACSTTPTTSSSTVRIRMCGIYYLGALRAGEEMARAVGDTASAAEYRRLFENGSQWIDANLFNGEYYIQTDPRRRRKTRSRLAAQHHGLRRHRESRSTRWATAAWSIS